MKRAVLSILILAGVTSAMAKVTPECVDREQNITNDQEVSNRVPEPVFEFSPPPPPPPPPVGLIENAQSLEFVLYPNPTSNVLNIRLDEVGQKMFANILDMSGRVILYDVSLSSGINTIDISALGSGVYTCLLQTNETTVNLKRFIVK
ncbi:MAG: T9SS type A sorting domain-containing protein [Crocinitomicaceae bacterium]|nr:T9SS type A sorting domain-containing protein [Crocinitomicaceae bacterium]